MNPTADQIVAAVRARGNDARDLRDAAHEAHHALFAKMRGKWERDRIHKALVRKASNMPGFLVGYEMDARAVEAVVCGRFGVTHDLKQWAGVCWMETFKTLGISLPSTEWIVECVEKRMKSKTITVAADKVIALGVSP